MDDKEILDRATKSLEIANEIQGIGDNILEMADDRGKYQQTIEEVIKFNLKFEEFQTLLDDLSLSNGLNIQPSGKQDEGNQDDLVSQLHRAIKKLIETHEKIIPVVQNMSEYTSERLGVIRKARGIFDKFVKMPETGPPKFYDKKG